MLAPEQGGKAPSGGMGGRGLCRGTARGPTRPEVFWGGGGPGSVAGCESPALLYGSGTISWTKASPETRPEMQLQSESARRFHRAQPDAPRDACCAPSLTINTHQSAPRNFKLSSPPSPLLHTLPIRLLKGSTWEPGWGHNGHRTTVLCDTGAGRSALVPPGFPSSSGETSHHLK